MFNQLQNNGASNYDHESLKYEITELRNNRIVDETFKIINPIEEVLNFLEDENSDVSC